MKKTVKNLISYVFLALLAFSCNKDSSSVNPNNVNFKLSTSKVYLGINNLLVSNTTTGFSNFEWQLDSNIVSFDKIPIITDDFYKPGKHYLKLVATDSLSQKSYSKIDSFLVIDTLRYSQIKVIEVKAPFYNLPSPDDSIDRRVGICLQFPIDSNGTFLDVGDAPQHGLAIPHEDALGVKWLLFMCNSVKNFLQTNNYYKISSCCQIYEGGKITLFRKINVLKDIYTLIPRGTCSKTYYTTITIPTSLSYSVSMKEIILDNDYFKISILVDN